ncbi:MAG: hypothetical protein QM808_00590 [Steroidobacteraceae bacterium]
MPNQEFSSSWDEYQGLLKQAKGGTQKTATNIPDWTGLWIRDSHGLGASFDDSAGAHPILGSTYGAGRNTASLTPKYQAAYDKKVADIAAGKEWDRLSYCLPAGFPRWLTEPFFREFIVTPKQVWMTHEQINETRRIYTDGRSHIPDEDAVPLWMGDSIGFWNGDTLIVHTNHMKAGEYQRSQPDFSFQISTVEQIRKVNANLIEDRITVYDPLSLTKPWHVVFQYKKVTNPALRVHYDACEENNNVYRGADGSTQYTLPGDKNYRDPSTFGIPEVAQDSMPK